jgi:hypothetical protein
VRQERWTALAGDHEGRAVTDALKAPVPAALRAATLNRYVTPLVSPVMVAVRDVDTPSETVVHVVPFVERWIT